MPDFHSARPPFPARPSFKVTLRNSGLVGVLCPRAGRQSFPFICVRISLCGLLVDKGGLLKPVCRGSSGRLSWPFKS